ncbi:MAG: hypothetical protein MZV70_71670 [Desulfobacterales bacterium]|nr:hypothetical protein [Desulfobacterales bacterium]
MANTVPPISPRGAGLLKRRRADCTSTWPGLLHDIGYVAIPGRGFWTAHARSREEERLLVKQHPVVGVDILVQPSAGSSRCWPRCGTTTKPSTAAATRTAERARRSRSAPRDPAPGRPLRPA